jgi:hypothetical protein
MKGVNPMTQADSVHSTPPTNTSVDSTRLIDQACDLYCQDIARIDILGPNRRIIFTIPSIDSTGYHNVVVKLILPADLMVTLAYMAAGADANRVSPQLLALEPRLAN